MSLPRLIVTGASGFVGRRLLEVVKSNWTVVAIDRRSQAECGAPTHPHISWQQLDISDYDAMETLFAEIRETGGADAVIHLAAYYDFTGEDHPEYQRTNIDGTRNVLELCRGLGISRFVYASSVAACSFPPPGQALTEDSPTDGNHVYAQSKHMGEKMLRQYVDEFSVTIVRFAAMFSDWCEYPPLFVFLDTWLSDRWNSRILGGQGLSAVPYLHVRDAVMFLRRVLDYSDQLGSYEVLNCSTDGSVSHRELFDASTAYFFGTARKPRHIPKPLARVGMSARNAMGRFLGSQPFERPWMADYIDLQLNVDATRTRELLEWEPHPRLEILRRIPFMLENMKTDPVEWFRRNSEAMQAVQMRPNLRIYRMLDARQDAFGKTFNEFLGSPEGRALLPTYKTLPAEEWAWHQKLIFRSLLNSVRTREKGIFMAYCRDLAERRYQQGFSLDEVCHALGTLDRICLGAINGSPGPGVLPQDLHDYISMTIQFGIDQVQEVYEYLDADLREVPRSRYQDQLWGYHKWSTAERPLRRRAGASGGSSGDEI